MATPTEAPVSKAKVEQGIIGFFDVLGYQTLIDRDQIEDVTILIDQKLLRVKENILDAYKAKIGEPLPQFVSDSIKCIVFSDTIILRAAFPSESQLVSQFTVFLAFSAHLQKIMFDDGLPLRG